RNNIINNIKQIGIAVRTWALDHQDKYPMQVQATNGGILELIGAGMAFMHFAVMSNELSTPRIVFCRQENDPKRVPATTFERVVSGLANKIPFTNNNNVSYFVDVDDLDTLPQMILHGDNTVAIVVVLAK